MPGICKLAYDQACVSHAGAFAFVIHKSSQAEKAVISAGMPKSSIQGWQHRVTTDVTASTSIKLRAGMLPDSSICTTD